jgi:photosystem II stability/assembly factor-like uncharacterized protein
MQLTRAIFVFALAIPTAGAAADTFWRNVSPPGIAGRVSVLAATAGASGPTLAVVDDRLWRTSDSGASWTELEPSVPGGERIVAIGIDPAFPSTVFLGSSDALEARGSVLRSGDGGETWTRLERYPGTAVSAPEIAVSPSGVSVGTTQGIYGSPDAGATWGVVGASGKRVASLAISRSLPRVGYAAAGRLYETTDGGRRWTAVNTGLDDILLFIGQVAIDPRDAQTAWAVTACPPCNLGPLGDAHTSDGGRTWVVGGPPQATAAASGVAFGADSSVFLGTRGEGVYRSADGRNWAAANAGLTDPSVTALTSDGQSVFAGTRAGLFAASAAGPCPSDALGLCLQTGRFRVAVAWTASNIGQSGSGRTVPLTADTGAFWFFQPSNLELVVKVLDGRTINGKFWVFWGALTNVGWTLTVTDTATGDVRTYTNPEGQQASGADTEAF